MVISRPRFHLWVELQVVLQWSQADIFPARVADLTTAIISSSLSSVL